MKKTKTRRTLAYSIDIMGELAKRGYNTYRIRKENILPQSTVTKINNGEMIGIISLEIIMNLLDMNLNEIITTVTVKDD